MRVQPQSLSYTAIQSMYRSSVKDLEKLYPTYSIDYFKKLLRELQQGDLISVAGKTSASRWFSRSRGLKH